VTPPTEVGAEAPQRIWLQDGCDDPDCGNARCQEIHACHEGVTWCSDQIHDNDTAFVRADLYESLALRCREAEAERDKARAALERIIGMCDVPPRCTCGRPNGLPAVTACASAALEGATREE
jgi:hypothetical protein